MKSKLASYFMVNILCVLSKKSLPQHLEYFYLQFLIKLSSFFLCWVVGFNTHLFSWMYPGIAASFVEITFLSLIKYLQTFVDHQLTFPVWVYCGLYSLPLIHLSLHILIPHCLDCWRSMQSHFQLHYSFIKIVPVILDF